MAGVSFSLPSPSLFHIPPLSGPTPLAPPSSFPIAIPQSIYAAALDVRVPLTIGALYAATAKTLNVYNRRRRAEAGGKPQPWPIARTRAFAVFVVLHNVLLAVYSAWSFAGMLGGMIRTVAGPSDVANGGWAGTVDSLCRVHGAPGLGNSVTWDDHLLQWKDLGDGNGTHVSTLVDAHHDMQQMGRLWNEGIAFYGWIFYLSKFYEVLDTLIILAKGKTSSVLQTYHHTGAMLAVWAGIRYMSAPIWMFVLINSGIHALMYTYYTLTAFSVYVPITVKRTLTTMQITQFLVGTSYAVLHSFISYTVPVTIAITTAIEGEHESTPSVEGIAAAATTSAGRFEKLRALLGSISAKTAGAAASASTVAEKTPVTITTYETIYTTQPCITTSGATFAVWLNVLYLTPLTVLFVNFFVSSYLRRSSAPAKTDLKRGEKANGHANGHANGNGKAIQAGLAGADAVDAVDKTASS